MFFSSEGRGAEKRAERTPGAPAERLDLESGILGQGQAGPSPAVEKAFRPGVLLERPAPFGVIEAGQDVGKPDDLEALQGPADLSDLARVPGRQEEAPLSQS